MCKSANTLDASADIGKSTYLFMKRKINTLMPYYIFACIISFFVWFAPFSNQKTLVMASTIPVNFIFPYVAGFKGYFYLGYSWYLSAMLYSMLIIFPFLLRDKIKNIYIYILSPLIIVFGLGFYSYTYDGLGIVSQKQYFYSNGIIRGLVGISLGCICYEISKKINELNWNRNGKIFILITEVVCLLCILYRVIFIQKNSIHDFITVFFIVILVSCSFYKNDYLSFEIRGKYAEYSGKLSYAVFINSNCWSYLMNRLFPTMNCYKATVIYICITFLVSIMCVYLCDKIISYNLKKLLIDENK